MPDLRRISVVAVVLLVLLRISIGWQFFYEGIWKLRTQQTANPWTSNGYLRNAQGPFRDEFRTLAGDPDELSWLDADAVERRWNQWAASFLATYGLSDAEIAAHKARIAELEKRPDRSAAETLELNRLQAELTDDQRLKRRIDVMLNGREHYAVPLEQLPEGVDFRRLVAHVYDEKGRLKRVQVVNYDPRRKLLVADGQAHLTPRERDRLLSQVAVAENPPPGEEAANEIHRQFHDAVNALFERSSRLSYKEQLRASLKGDPERATQIFERYEGTIDHRRLGQIDLYKQRLEEYEQNLARAETDFQFQHLDRDWRELQQMRTELVAPVKALDAELRARAA
ncbi:MAG: hypothetical protein ACREJB_13785, partial [Planctomycetaceae bacterium]